MMGSSTQNAVTILEVSRVAPAPGSPELSLPLTFFDTAWFKFYPVERIFFYQFPNLTPTHFNSVIVPILKRSLSLTLTHFSPLAGRLKWPAHDPVPSVLYRPNDSVSLTIAESKNPESFVHLAGSKPYKAIESRPYVPELHVTDSEAAVISFQATLFPNHGLAIGISVHHAILDGKSTTLFLKAWAHMSKYLCTDSGLEAPYLPPELTPFLHRSVIQDPDGIALEYLDVWVKMTSSSPSNPRSLKLLPAFDLDPTLVRATFEVFPEDVTKLRELVLSKLGLNDNNATDNQTLHLSTFVLNFSHALTCLVKAIHLGISARKIHFVFPVDCRARLEPPLPSTYLGNCVGGCDTVLDSEVIRGDDGFVMVAKRASQGIKELGSKSIYEWIKKDIDDDGIAHDVESKIIGVAGSPRFEVYKTDFGWGRPVKVDVTSIDRTGAISMAERKDGPGGVEIGVVLTQDEMEVFETLFVGGLKDL